MYYFPFAIFTLLFIVFISFISYSNRSGSGNKSPPGPRRVPILGYLPFTDTNLLHQFNDLARKYGQIYQLQLGNKLCVVINSPSLVKEVVRDHDVIFSYRDTPVAAFVSTYGACDIVFSTPNSEWKALRKIFVREMLSNNSLEVSYNLRKNEVRKTIRQVYNMDGKAAGVEISELSFQTQLNVITNLLWGGLVEGEDGERLGKEFSGIARKLVDLLGKPNISDFYPFLAWFDIQGVKREMEKYVHYVDEIFEVVIAKHKNKMSRGATGHGNKDILQILLELMDNDQDSAAMITHTQLKALMMDIVAGGTDTTATTVEWAMAELINNPETMEKVQEELSNIVGLENKVEEHHIPELKYLQAILKETLRLHPAVPFLVPKSSIQSSTIGGYFIPKNTRVFINVAYIHRDPSLWDDPNEFRPQRFLDGKWDFSGNNFQYLPFGSGRRICAGIPLAERIAMFILASFLHSFDWKLPNDVKLDMSGAFGIVLRKKVPLVAIPCARLSDSKVYV